MDLKAVGQRIKAAREARLQEKQGILHRKNWQRW